MRDRQAGAQRGAVAAIEGEQRLAGAVAKPARESPPDGGGDPVRPQSLAFDAQIGDLVERIEGSQARIELQAVDDSHGLPEKDVLGAQIAVGLDDAAFENAADQQP